MIVIFTPVIIVFSIDGPSDLSENWPALFWFWIFLILLLDQHNELRIPNDSVRVSASYIEYSRKISTYLILMIVTLSLGIFIALATGWEIPTSPVATILSVAGFIDLFGKDYVKRIEAFEIAKIARERKFVEINRELGGDWQYPSEILETPRVSRVRTVLLPAALGGVLALIMYDARSGNNWRKNTEGSMPAVDVDLWPIIIIMFISAILSIIYLLDAGWLFRYKFIIWEKSTFAEFMKSFGALPVTGNENYLSKVCSQGSHKFECGCRRHGPS